MSSLNGLTPAQRLRLVCEMHDMGVAMMRQSFRRKHADAPPAEIERKLIEWLHTRPGAEHGDVAGPGLRVRES